MWHKYSQLSISERDELEFFLSERKHSLRTIAKMMHRNVSTISREIKNNRNAFTLKYTRKTAKQKAYVRKKYCKYQKRKILENMKLRQFIEKHLRLDWSPEEVAGRIAEEFSLFRLDAKCSKNTIYKYLHSVQWQLIAYDLNLHKIKKRGKKKKEWLESGEILSHWDKRIFIDDRPIATNERLLFGDWEWDFIVSPKDPKTGKQYQWSLLVLHERKSRFVLIRKLTTRNIEDVHAVIKRMLQPIQNLNSLTLDNDIAFKRHWELSELIWVPIYFCHPYHSWEKWWVEFSNRLIREYFPKWTNLAEIDEDDILDVEVLLNNRPRKILGYKTPLEVMKENNSFFHTFDTYPCTTRPI